VACLTWGFMFMKFLVFQHIVCRRLGIFRNLLRQVKIEWNVVDLHKERAFYAWMDRCVVGDGLTNECMR